MAAVIGGIPSASRTTGGEGSKTALAGRDETLAVADVLVSNLLGTGDTELNVVGVGIGADMDGMLRPLAQASRGEAYHAIPDIADPKALAVWLRQIYREIGGRRPIQLIATQ